MKSFLTVLRTLFLMYSFSAIAADDYMSLLEAEAEGSELDHGGQLEAGGTKYKDPAGLVERKWQGECDYAADVLPTDLVHEEFASYMKKCTLSIFVYYRKLDADSKNLVYEKYKKTIPIKLSSLRKAVLSYL
jgi:hypothetical protein